VTGPLPRSPEKYGKDIFHMAPRTDVYFYHRKDMMMLTNSRVKVWMHFK
jgi:hypothetical protein